MYSRSPHDGPSNNSHTSERVLALLCVRTLVHSDTALRCSPVAGGHSQSLETLRPWTDSNVGWQSSLLIPTEDALLRIDFDSFGVVYNVIGAIGSGVCGVLSLVSAVIIGARRSLLSAMVRLIRVRSALSRI